MAGEYEHEDMVLQHEVLQALEQDSRVCATDVGVTVHHGVVTLTGIVPDYGERLAAADVAHHVSGVLDVADDMEVKGPGTGGYTDTQIAETVRDLFAHDEAVPAGRVHTTVSRGWIRLEGAVPLAGQRYEAERQVWRVPGVRGVTNAIAVTSCMGVAGEILSAVAGAGKA